MNGPTCTGTRFHQHCDRSAEFSSRCLEASVLILGTLPPSFFLWCLFGALLCRNRGFRPSARPPSGRAGGGGGIGRGTAGGYLRLRVIFLFFGNFSSSWIVGKLIGFLCTIPPLHTRHVTCSTKCPCCVAACQHTSECAVQSHPPPKRREKCVRSAPPSVNVFFPPL